MLLSWIDEKTWLGNSSQPTIWQWVNCTNAKTRGQEAGIFKMDVAVNIKNGLVKKEDQIQKIDSFVEIN